MCISWGIGVWLSLALLSSRALLDITSGPEVRQIFKVWTVRQIGHMNFGIFEVFSVEI